MERHGIGIRILRGQAIEQLPPTLKGDRGEHMEMNTIRGMEKRNELRRMG